MKKSLLYFLIIIINTALVAETRVALVIGNSNYVAWGKLKNTKNDARDMKNLLKSRGFDVLYGIDLTKKEFEDLLIKFKNRLSINRENIGLFYFSGHGMEIQHSNYLIPIDSKEAKPHLNIALDKVIYDMNSAKNQLNIIILDACRDNPFIYTLPTNTTERSIHTKISGGFSEISIPEGLFIAYATKSGKVAWGGGNIGLKNGLFTKYLLDYMKEPLPLYKIFLKTKRKVFKISKKKQLPTFYDQTTGEDFYITQPPSPNPPPYKPSTLSHIPIYCDYQDNDFD